VIESLDRRYQLGTGIVDRRSAGQTDATWQFARKQVSEYVEALHAETQHGWTPFKLIWKSIRDRTIHFDIFDALKIIDIPTRLLNNDEEVTFCRGRLVARFSQIEGYRCLSLMRAFVVVKCQLAFA
jgi:hypothetical protein